MSLIDLNELPQPIYPEQVAPATDETTKTANTAKTGTATTIGAGITAEQVSEKVSAAAEQLTEKVTATVEGLRRMGAKEATPLLKNTNLLKNTGLLKNSKIRIAVAVVGVLAVISGISDMVGGAKAVAQESQSGSTPSTATVNTTGADGDLADALDEILFAYASPSDSTFQCMAGQMSGAGYTASDVRNLTVNANTLASAIAGCASGNDLLIEATGFTSDLYGAGYTSDCLANTFATFGAGEWQQWFSVALTAQTVEDLDGLLFSLNQSCFS